MNKYILSERQNLFEPNDYISIYAHIKGVSDISALEAAVHSAFNANETTMSRIVLDEMGRAYYEKLNESGCKVELVSQDKLQNEQGHPVKIEQLSQVVQPNQPAKYWRQVISENEKDVFRLWDGELMRVFLWEDGHILMMSHHLAGDGLSGSIFLKDVLKALNGEALTYKSARVLTLDVLEAMSGFTSIQSRYVDYLNNNRKLNNHIYDWEDYRTMHKKYWSANRSEITVIEYSCEETAAIISKAKQAGVTVNSYITADIVSHYTSKNVIGIPVSIRDDDVSMSNQVSGIQISHRYNKNESLEQNAQNIQRKCRERIMNDNSKHFVLLFMAKLNGSLVDGLQVAARGFSRNSKLTRSAKLMGFAGKKRRDIGITNLGVIDFTDAEREGNHAIDSLVFVPPAVVYSDNIYGISTVKGRMTITYHGMTQHTFTDV